MPFAPGTLDQAAARLAGNVLSGGPSGSDWGGATLRVVALAL